MCDKFLYTNLLIKSFTQQHLSESEIELIKFLLTNNPTQNKADMIFNNINIENISDNKILFISYFIKLNPQITLNDKLLTKIKIVKDFYMKKRMELYVHLDKILQKYNAINENPMLLKGAAMSYLNPNLLRTMSDIDILVSNNSYNN